MTLWCSNFPRGKARGDPSWNLALSQVLEFTVGIAVGIFCRIAIGIAREC